MPGRMWTIFPRPMQLVQAAAQVLNLLLISGLLALRQFKGLKHLIHVLHCGAECLDDLVDFFYGLLDCHRSVRLRQAHRQWR